MHGYVLHVSLYNQYICCHDYSEDIYREGERERERKRSYSCTKGMIAKEVPLFFHLCTHFGIKVVFGDKGHEMNDKEDSHHLFFFLLCEREAIISIIMILRFCLTLCAGCF